MLSFLSRLFPRRVHRRVTPEVVTELAPDEVFVFGSNIDGKHRAGAARAALEFGAVWGEGRGLHGQTYAIVTMSGPDVLAAEVTQFLRFAADHPELTFLVTPVGCGIAGYTPEEVAPLFAGSPRNVVLPEPFLAVIARKVR